jgi:uncharacterized membrane protein
MIAASTRAVAAVLLFAATGACAHESPPPAVAARPHAEAKPGACHRTASACSGAPLTYEHDVRPILAARCFKCHAGDGVAADEHDFSRVAVLRAQRVALANEISACAMPPSGEPELGEAEARVVLTWATCGANE